MRLRAALAAVLALGMAPTPTAARAPDLSVCPPPEQPGGGEVERTGPIPVPAALRRIVASGRYHFAVTTLSGQTFCIDNSWTEGVEDMTLSADGRFVSWQWHGYETYGHDLVDRAGAGALHEIGARPVFSPTGHRFAAIDQTESEFGALSGLAIWRIDPASVVRIGQIEDIPRRDNWHIDGWLGEDCVRISAIANGRTPDDPALWARAPRERHVARAVRGRWVLARGTSGCPRK